MNTQRRETVLVTGTTSGIGKELVILLKPHYDVIELNRTELDLAVQDDVLNYEMPVVDILVNCAGHDHGGKVPFKEHHINHILSIMNTNLIAPMLLTRKAFEKNRFLRVINVTSTNIEHYWRDDLTYTLSKKALSEFGSLLDLEGVQVQELCPGLTKTNFNKSRHKWGHKRIDDLYDNHHLHPAVVARCLYSMIGAEDMTKVVMKP